MPVTSLNWIKPADPAAEWTRGVQLGQQASEAEARLNAEQARTQMEAQQQHERLQAETQARAAVLQKDTLLQQQRIQVETAYRNTQLDLQKQRLAEAAKVNDAKTRDAALRAADQQGFAADLAAGMPIEHALYRHPRVTTPAAAIAAHKDTLDRAGDRLDLSKQRLEIQQQALEQRAQQFEDRQRVAGEKMQRVGETVETDPTDPNKRTTTYKFGKPGATEGERVRVKHPDGRVGTIDSDKLEDALKKGYTRLD